MLNTIVEKIENKKSIINKFAPLFLMSYFVIISSPYLFARSVALNYFFTHSQAFNIIRLLAISTYALYGFLIMIANRLRTNWLLLFGMIFLLFLMVINSVVSPSSIVYYSFYFTGKVAISSTSIGIYTHLVHIARFTGDLVSLFFLFCSYPFVFRNRNQFSYVVIPSVVIAFIGIVYTVLFERGTIEYVLNGGNPESLKSIFHSKNAYGIFLFNGAAASTFIFFSNSKRWTKIIVLLVPLFLIMSFLINCKLVAVCILVLLILSYIYSIIRYFKSRAYISYILLGILLFLSIAIVLIFSLPQLRSNNLISKIYDRIIESITSLDISSFIGRTNEWEVVPRMTSGVYSIIGFSTAVGYQLVTAYTSINGTTAASLYDLHNAYVDFYAYHGIIGCVLLGLFYIYMFYLIFKLLKKDSDMALLIAMILIVSILFGMAETYRLFLSMSANTFALNIMILGVLLFELKDDETVFRPNISFSKLIKKNKEIANNA